jgi:hypothetical protein
VGVGHLRGRSGYTGHLHHLLSMLILTLQAWATIGVALLVFCLIMDWIQGGSSFEESVAMYGLLPMLVVLALSVIFWPWCLWQLIKD